MGKLSETNKYLQKKDLTMYQAYCKMLALKKTIDSYFQEVLAANTAEDGMTSHNCRDAQQDESLMRLRTVDEVLLAATGKDFSKHTLVSSRDLEALRRTCTHI